MGVGKRRRRRGLKSIVPFPPFSSSLLLSLPPVAMIKGINT